MLEARSLAAEDVLAKARIMGAAGAGRPPRRGLLRNHPGGPPDSHRFLRACLGLQ